MIDAHIMTWPNLTTPAGQHEVMPWGRLFTMFSNWRLYAGDNEQPGWSATRCEPARRGLENVKAVSALVLDYDDGTALDEIELTWRGTYGLLHTTRKHQPETPRCRVILPFSRLATPEEFDAVWARKTPYNTDQSTKDASRFWFVPGSASEGTFECRWLEGVPLDVDAILAEPGPKPSATAARAHTTDESERRASAYIAKMPAAISGSAGHQALWQVALVAVCGFGLSDNAAFNLIKSEYNPRCQPPWRDRELLHKVADAINKSRVPFGFKLDEDRDWRRTPTSLPRRDPDAQPNEDAEPTPERGDAWEPSSDDKNAAPSRSARKPERSSDPVLRYNIKSVAELLNGVYVRVTTEKPKGGCPTGVGMIDRTIGGFRRGMITILGASTSWGKSSLALLTAESCSRAGKRVLLISGEDSEDLYGNRLMARRANVNAMNLRDNNVSQGEWTVMAGTIKDAEQDPFFVNAVGKTAEDMAECIRLVCEKRDMDLVIVDYIGVFKSERRTQDRRTEVNHVARTLIDAIKVGGSSGLVLSQIKRIEGNKAATMHDLKESGDLENMAEHVLIGWVATDARDQEDQREWKRMITVAKNKDGPPLSKPLQLEFDDRTASFTGRTLYEGQAYQ